MIQSELKKHLLSSRLIQDALKEVYDGATTANGSDSASRKRSSPVAPPSAEKKGKLAIAPSAAELAEGRAKQAARQTLDDAEEETHLARMRGGRMDMFCRKENKPSNSNRPPAGPAADAASALALAVRLKREKSNVRFKYNQGYSNAVKRPVEISDFM